MADAVAYGPLIFTDRKQLLCDFILSTSLQILSGMVQGGKFLLFDLLYF